ncbi:MAG TPA: hypothetical protein VFL34_02900 [Candidatus Sulfotelmatobacter sp.]|nr:hypothetical protein [Candidatus Sulfotelmatobacter sp.]
MLNRLGALLLLVPAALTFAANPAPRAQELFVPYWTSETGWETELRLKNNLASEPLTVTPLLRSASGQEVSLTRVIIPANGSVSVLVNQDLMERSPAVFGQPGSYGSVALRYTSVSAMNLDATAIVSLHGRPIAFPVRANPSRQVAEKTPRSGGSLEGVWRRGDAGLNDFLVISNSSDRNVSGSLLLFDADGAKWAEPIALGPQQTERLAMSGLLQKAALSGAYGGISIQLPPAIVNAIHFTYDESGKFSESLEMFNHDTNVSPRGSPGNDAAQITLRAPMLALRNPDPVLGLPSGTVLHPTILVRNTTSRRTSFSLVLDWRGPSGQGRVTFPVMNLAPFATEQLPIEAQQQSGIPGDAHWALVSLTGTAAPDDLIAIASSRDSTGRAGIEAKFVGDTSGHSAGGEWPADANHNTIAAITNIGTKPAEALLTLHYDSGKQKFELQRTIAPGDQMWVNLAQLIRQRIPDRNGSTLPVDVSAVTYDLRDLTQGGHGLIASALVVNSTYGFLASPEIAKCCSTESPGWSPNFFDLLIGASDPGAIYGTDSCNGELVDISGDFSNWWSGNTAVATVASRQVHGVAAGSTYAYASGYIYMWNGAGCSLEPAQFQAPVTVKPTVTISGSTYLAMLNSGATGGGNTTTLTAAGNPSGGTYSWSAVSGQGNITISSAGSQTATIQAAAVGTYTVQVTYSVNNQQGTATTVGRVQQPGSLAVISDDTTTYNCALAGYPYFTQERDIQYQVLDTSSPPAPVQAQQMSATETLNASINTCNSSWVPTVGAKTGTNGYFPAPDHIRDCSAKCLPADTSGNPTGSCQLVVSQTWEVNGYSVKSDTINFTCAGPPTGVP